MKLAKCCICGFFLVFLFGFSVLQLLPDSTFSEQENRVLAQFPEWSIESAASGEFADQMEEYASDQFPFRNGWVLINHLMDRFLLKIETGGNYVLSDRIIQQFNDYDADKVLKNIRKINEFSALIVQDVDLLLIPTASEIERDRLSDFVNDVDQKQLLSEIKGLLEETVKFVDCYESLAEAEEDVFYATDHHYNEKGAYLVYESYLQHLGKSASEFVMEKVSDDFCGTLYSASGAYYMGCDAIWRIDPKEEVSVQVEYEENGIIVDSVYNEDNLSIKDKYTYYLDGNHSIVNITTSLTDKPSLLLIGDSYTHLMVPYLISEFSEIKVVDLRYYRLALSDDASNYDQVLILYSLENFVEDDGLSWLR